MLRFLILLAAAIAILILGTALIWMLQRARQGAAQRKRKTAASRRRVANAADRADMAVGTISVPDRFGALGTMEIPVELTAEPQPGDLSTSVVSPAPPFDLTAPGASEALQDWETATIPRRRTIMIRGYLSHPLPRVRSEALDLVGTLGSEDSRAPQHLALLLRDDAEVIRTKAAKVAWSSGVDAVVEALRSDPDPDAASKGHDELVRNAPNGREAPALQ